MKKAIQTIYTEEEFRSIIRQEVKAVLSGEINQIGAGGDEGFLNVSQAADFLKLASRTVYNLVNKKELPFHKKPGSNRVLFMKSELLKWLKEGK